MYLNEITIKWFTLLYFLLMCCQWLSDVRRRQSLLCVSCGGECCNNGVVSMEIFKSCLGISSVRGVTF